MICPKCKTRIPEDSDFCQKCGEKVILPVAEKAGEGNARWKIPVIILSITTVLGLVFGGVSLYLYYTSATEVSRLRTQVADLQNENADLNVIVARDEKGISDANEKSNKLQTDYDILKRGYDKLSEHYWEYQSKAEFMDKYVVICGANDDYYHKYDCDYLDLSSFYVMASIVLRDSIP